MFPRIFFINLPTGGLALALVFLNLKLNAHAGSTFENLLRTFDWSGLFLLVVGIVLLLVGFANGETVWLSAQTIVLIALGIILLVAAVWNETWTSRSPIIPKRIFKAC